MGREASAGTHEPLLFGLGGQGRKTSSAVSNPGGGTAPSGAAPSGCANRSTTLRTKLLDAPTGGVLSWQCATYFPRSCEGGQTMSEAPGPTALATTQLLPYL